MFVIIAQCFAKIFLIDIVKTSRKYQYHPAEGIGIP